MALALLPVQAGAQQAAVLRGEVRAGEMPVRAGTVILHRVTAESSGEVDSVRVGSDGRFSVTLPYLPDHRTRPEILFASYLYSGIAYFGPPITEGFQLDSLYRIQVYDTVSVTAGGALLPISARSLFLERSQDGWGVADVFQVVQGGERTLYSPEDRVIWSHPLPPGALDFQVGQADLASDAVRFAGGQLEIYAPMQPGERFILVRYRVPTLDLEIPLVGRTDRLEILVREPAPEVEFPPLAAGAPVEMEPGNSFRRFTGSALQDTIVRARVAPQPWRLPAEWLGVLLAGALGVAGVWGYRRRSRGADGAPTPEPGPTRARVLVAVAALDEEFAEGGDTSPEERARYQARRAELLSGLRQP
jgi:hypothetical protein